MSLYEITAFSLKHTGPIRNLILMPNKFLRYDEQEVYNSTAKFAYEESRSGRGLGVHFRCLHNNKYLVWHKTLDWIVAEAEKPVEDTSSRGCTLFRVETETNTTVSWVHVGTNRTVSIVPANDPIDSFYLTIRNTGVSDEVECTPIDVERIIKLPKTILFKGDNDLYLGAQGDPRSFLGKDRYRKDLWYETFPVNNGDVRLRSVQNQKFLRRGSNEIIAADSDNTTSADSNTVFQIVSLVDNTIALINRGNNKFCQRADNRFKAEIDSGVKESQLIVEEPIIRRLILVRKSKMTREEADIRGDDMLIDGSNLQNPNPRHGDSFADEFNPNYLKAYYAKLFPYTEMFKWMSYGNDGKHSSCDQSYFSRREFSFTLDNEIYLRYQSFKSVVEFESAVKEKCPFKIDIGPVFSNDPSKRHAYAQITPVERELVFDIDITDYDDVRFCCTKADMCYDCWPLMTVAIKVVDAALRYDFGFNHILWVYSGRRGVHCWVCDAKARRLTNEQRSSIAEYFCVYKSNENRRKVSFGGPALHPFLVRSYAEYMKGFFEETYLRSQKLLSSEDRYEKVLEMIPDESATSELRGKWQDSRKSSMSTEDLSVARWEQLKQVLQSGKQKGQGIRRCVEEIVCSHVYPRLDMEVSKHMNHLLKAPFCVHPKTGRVCVPIDPNRCELFDPASVPTLSQLLEELNMKSSGTDVETDLDRTSLGKAVAFFRSSFLQPLLKSCKEDLEISYSKKLQQKKDSMNW